MNTPKMAKPKAVRSRMPSILKNQTSLPIRYRRERLAATDVASRMPITGSMIRPVDPATRDYILSTIISNYNPEAAVIISTHLISDVEKVLDEVIFINRGQVMLQSSVDEIREEKGMSVDVLFREVFKC